MVSQRGIEIDLHKIRAIVEMKPPRTEKEIQAFLGRIQYISRFIAQLTMTCEPIFRLLKKEVPTVWNEQCQEAFEKIKSYLMKPPILVLTVLEKPLLSYLTTTDHGGHIATRSCHLALKMLMLLTNEQPALCCMI